MAPLRAVPPEDGYRRLVAPVVLGAPRILELPAPAPVACQPIVEVLRRGLRGYFAVSIFFAASAPAFAAAAFSPAPISFTSTLILKIFPVNPLAAGL